MTNQQASWLLPLGQILQVGPEPGGNRQGADTGPALFHGDTDDGSPRVQVLCESWGPDCEAYARILERAPKLQDRRGLAIEYASKVRVSAESVDPVEVNSILADACAARNGWKIILPVRTGEALASA